MDTAVASGANEVTSIRFTMIQTQSYELQALSLAIRNAQQKALTIAHTLGATLASTPYQVKELTYSSEPVPYMASKLAASAATPIQPGQLEFRARVQAGFHY
ncbi:oxidative stress defense protein [compost metagenome]